MRWLFVVGAVVAVGACKSKSNDAPPPPPSATPSSTTGPSGSATAMTKPTTTTSTIASAPANAGPGPRYLRRVHPDKVDASSIYDDKKTHEKHPALDAFDGNLGTEWAEGVDGDGKGEWIEASFTKPRAIWGIVADTGIVITRTQFGDVFPLNAHAKRLRLTIDGADAFARDVDELEPQIGWDGIARDVTTLRFVADDVWPGTKWHDFGITEITLLADASAFPSVPTSIVQAEADAVSTPEAAAAVLKRFGVNPPQSQLDGRTAVASLVRSSMVDDQPRDFVLYVSLVGPEDASGSRAEDAWIVFLGTTDDDRLVGLGSDWVSAKTTKETPFVFGIDKIHTPSVDDFYVKWFSGVRVWTMERGFVETIAAVTAEKEGAAGIDEDSAPPKTITAGMQTSKYEARAHRYR
jgi:hypothetical protein